MVSKFDMANFDIIQANTETGVYTLDCLGGTDYKEAVVESIAKVVQITAEVVRPLLSTNLTSEEIAVTISKITGVFTFGDVIVTVKSDSNPELLQRDLWLALYGYVDPDIGPYPSDTDPSEVLAA
jgi:hypothetical protein